MIIFIILIIIVAVIFTVPIIIWVKKARRQQAPIIPGIQLGMVIGLTIFTSTIVPLGITELALSVFTEDVLWITNARYWDVKILIVYAFFGLITMLFALVCSALFFFIPLRDKIGRQCPKLRVYGRKKII